MLEWSGKADEKTYRYMKGAETAGEGIRRKTAVVDKDTKDSKEPLSFVKLGGFYFICWKLLISQHIKMLLLQFYGCYSKLNIIVENDSK